MPAIGRAMPSRNLNSSLRRRVTQDPMREFDALPAPLRQWLAMALLPWSARSARRLWERALLRTGGDTAQALAALQAAEAGTLARDLRRTWGPDHPALAGTRRQPSQAGAPASLPAEGPQLQRSSISGLGLAKRARSAGQPG